MLFDLVQIKILKSNGCLVCTGRSLWALRCRAETSTCMRGCVATVCPWSPSAEDVWCVRTVCSCVPRARESSTHSAHSLTTSTKRWCREKRCVHFWSFIHVCRRCYSKSQVVPAVHRGSCFAMLTHPQRTYCKHTHHVVSNCTHLTVCIKDLTLLLSLYADTVFLLLLSAKTSSIQPLQGLLLLCFLCTEWFILPAYRKYFSMLCAFHIELHIKSSY